MIKAFAEKNRIAVIGGVGLLLVLALFGTSLSLTKAKQEAVVGYVNSEDLVKYFMEPAVKGPLTQETDRLQRELDAEIAKLQNDDENKKFEEAQALKNKYQAVLDQKKQELIAPLLVQTQDSIQRVAEKRGITLVLDNTYGFVLYGGMDLTEEILQELLQDK